MSKKAAEAFTSSTLSDAMFAGTIPRSPRNLDDVDDLLLRSDLPGGGGGGWVLDRLPISDSLSLDSVNTGWKLSRLSTLLARRRRRR